MSAFAFVNLFANGNQIAEILPRERSFFPEVESVLRRETHVFLEGPIDFPYAEIRMVSSIASKIDYFILPKLDVASNFSNKLVG